jgi:hypothetical protein
MTVALDSLLPVFASTVQAPTIKLTASPAVGYVLTSDGAGLGAWAQNKVAIEFVIDGDGVAITTGEKGHIEIPFGMVITGWTLLGDQTGSIEIDVWKDTYANFPPTIADTIAGTELPTISAATKGQDLTLSSWTTAVAAGDVLAFNVNSAATITRATLSIRGYKV